MTATVENQSLAAARYQNAAQWLRDLGDVPLDRILCTPWPGSATEEDLLRKIEIDKQLCELIDGTLVEKPAGLYESLLAMVLSNHLMNFVFARNLGAVTGEGGPLRLRMGLVRLPDIAFISSARLKAAGGITEQIPSLIPDLAVEVLSPSNTRAEMRRKREEYFSAGVRRVWLIDPVTRTAEVFAAPQKSVTIDVTGAVDGEDVLPGFSLSLKELFEVADRILAGTA